MINVINETVIVPGEGGRVFLTRLSVVPFESAIALSAVWAGTASLFGISGSGAAFNATLPHPLVVLFNIMYIVSGVVTVLGLGFGYRNLEGFGLVTLATSLAIRLIALAVISGVQPDTITAIVQAMIFIPASLVRLVSLTHGVEVVPVKLEEQVHIEEMAPVVDKTNGS